MLRNGIELRPSVASKRNICLPPREKTKKQKARQPTLLYKINKVNCHK